MKFLLKLSGENFQLAKFEVDSLFSVNSKLKGNLAELDVKIPQIDVVERLEFSSMVKKAYFNGKEVWRVHQGRFLDREPTKKPEFHPSTLKPKMARLLVNLAQPKKQILDPFCGAGSILLEACLLGYKATGIDIEWKSSQRAKKNMRFYGEKYNLEEGKDWQVIISDSTKLDKLFKKVECIATDPPYGRASTLAGKKIRALYEEFLQAASKVVQGRIAIMKPKDLHIRIPKKLKILGSFDWYVHKSLTREILILINNS